MKLKYKKMILLTTICTMGIGMVILSIIQERPRAEGLVAASEDDNKKAEDNIDLFAKNDSGDKDINAEPTATPKPSPTPTPIPVYDLEDSGYPEIEELFESYYAAKTKPDVKKIKSLLSNPEHVYSEEELLERTGFVEEYRNIKPYVKKSLYEDTYIVYAYSEIKITGIETPAPGLARFYLITDDEGDLKIYSEEMDEEIAAYYKDRNKDDDVKKLIDKTEKAFVKAKEKDEDLFNFWEAIEVTEASED